MVLIVSAYMTFAGVALLALAMAKHHRHAFARAPSPRRAGRLRVAGGLLLAAAAGLWSWDMGVDMGLVSWLLWLLPVAAIGVALGLAYAPRLLARSALIGFLQASERPSSAERKTDRT